MRERRAAGGRKARRRRTAAPARGRGRGGSAQREAGNVPAPPAQPPHRGPAAHGGRVRCRRPRGGTAQRPSSSAKAKTEVLDNSAGAAYAHAQASSVTGKIGVVAPSLEQRGRSRRIGKTSHEPTNQHVVGRDEPTPVMWSPGRWGASGETGLFPRAGFFVVRFLADRAPGIRLGRAPATGRPTRRQTIGQGWGHRAKDESPPLGSPPDAEPEHERAATAHRDAAAPTHPSGSQHGVLDQR